MNDVVINKIQSLQRCVRRAREEHAAAGDHFDSDASRQDAAVLNLIRACETCIDLANYMIREHKLGIPGSSAESVTLLAAEGRISQALAGRLHKMVGFRNVAVHAYRELDLNIVRWAIQSGSDELISFGDAILANYR